MLGMVELKEGNLRQAYGILSKAVELSPDNLEAQLHLGRLLLAGKAPEKAMEKARVLKPGDMRLASRMAEVLIESNRAKEALEILSPFIDRSDQPLPGAIFRILGKAYRALNQWQEAKTSWQQAIKNNHEDSESMALLALGYLEETNDWETAAKLRRQAEALGGKSKQTRTILGQLNKKLNSINHQK